MPAEIPEGLLQLQQEVPENLIGKLPKITCSDCRKKENRGQCGQHQKLRCQICDGWITTAHLHLDYVGHAETTSKLLEVDVLWNWEPLAFGPDGLPQFDPDGGLWIRLTVCGVTRLGYGTADNANGFKSRGDMRKEIIGDAIRNAAMRYGWALNLWAKTDIHERIPQEEPAPQPAPQQQPAQPQRPRPLASTDQKRDLAILCGQKLGFTERRARLIAMSNRFKRLITSFDDMFADEADTAIRELRPRPDFVPPQTQEVYNRLHKAIEDADLDTIGQAQSTATEARDAGQIPQAAWEQLADFAEARTAALIADAAGERDWPAQAGSEAPDAQQLAGAPA